MISFFQLLQTAAGDGEIQNTKGCLLIRLYSCMANIRIAGGLPRCCKRIANKIRETTILIIDESFSGIIYTKHNESPWAYATGYQMQSEGLHHSNSVAVCPTDVG